jgi:hypothetical protein
MVTGVLMVRDENLGVYTIMEKGENGLEYVPLEHSNWEEAHTWMPYGWDKKIPLKGKNQEERFKSMSRHIDRVLAKLEPKRISSFRVLLKHSQPQKSIKRPGGGYFFEYRILVGY